MPTLMSARLLALLLSAVTALEPTVLDDIAAVREHSYIRRKPACAKAGDASNVAPLPKVLHQMWWQGEAAVPDDYATMRSSWAVAHPSWNIKLWDEAKATALINNSYAWFAPTFHTLPSKIQKADAARYAILHSEGGVYADMDVEAFRPLDEVLTPRGAAPTIHLFEEPATHWEAHGTVISNGMMAAPPKHPLLLAVLRSIRPVAAVFASGGSHMLQAALTRCNAEEEEAGEAGRSDAPCGCYLTHSAANFFPLHEAMRQPNEFVRVGEQADAVRALVEDLGSGAWPPSTAHTAQHWTGMHATGRICNTHTTRACAGATQTCFLPRFAPTRAGSWIDAERGSFWLRGIKAARENRTDDAEKLLLAVVWSKWGQKYKYNNAPANPDPELAKKAYERAIAWRPDYGFAHYELGNLALEASSAEEAGSAPAKEQLAKATGHFTEAVRLSPRSLLFVNNLGVSLINQGKAEEAIALFRRVLELHDEGKSFIAIKGLDPEAGAHLNIGHALVQLGRREEAHGHWLTALRVGNYEHAVQAVQRLVADQASDLLPHAAMLDLRFGEALAKEGRTRDAALRYAAAHVSAANLTSDDPVTGGDPLNRVTPEAVRATVKARMLALSEVWEEGEGALAESEPRGGGNAGGGDRVQVVQASADGTMKRTEMTQEEMMASLKSAQSKAKGPTKTKGPTKSKSGP